VLALVLAGVGVATSIGPWAWRGGTQAVGPWGVALIVGAAVALTVRRLRPFATLLVTAAATSAYVAAGFPYGLILLSLVVAVYTMAAGLPARRATLGGVLALAALLVHVDSFRSLGPASAWVVLPFVVGWAVRISRESSARDRADEVRRQAYEERLRVAQEVHDVVGHGLAAITMQAEIALHVLAKRPEQAVTALTTISRTSRLALDELRATLDVVRSDSAAPPTPEPGLAGLDALVSRMTGTGVAVTATVSGVPRPLPAAVDLAAYRIVQESLTNVLRHANSATAVVSVRYQPRHLVVEVTDSGQVTSAGNDGGHGIPGMAARAGALGGVFAAGPRPEGGFRVHARLPIPEGAA
jgi:signal transduction histidine kinase